MGAIPQAVVDQYDPDTAARKEKPMRLWERPRSEARATRRDSKQRKPSPLGKRSRASKSAAPAEAWWGHVDDGDSPLTPSPLPSPPPPEEGEEGEEGEAAEGEREAAEAAERAARAKAEDEARLAEEAKAAEEEAADREAAAPPG